MNVPLSRHIPRTPKHCAVVAPVRTPSPLMPQHATAGGLTVSSPHDAAEREAVQVARRVVSLPSAPVSASSTHFAGLVPASAQRAPSAEKAQPAPARATALPTGGQPLPRNVRDFMEPRFGTDFSAVRIHTGPQAAQASRILNAAAFTVGHDIFFGRDAFHPDSSVGRELIAHELTHTIQQSAATQTQAQARRSLLPGVLEHSPPAVQRLGISDALDYFADHANYLPGFRMFTLVLGVNPINMRATERTPANLLRAVVELIPGGALVTQALDNHGIIDRVAVWVQQQIATLGLIGSSIRQAVDHFLDSLGWRDIFDLGGVWERAKRIVTEPIARITSFVGNLVSGVLQFIRDAILRPLAGLATGTRGWDLLCAVLGHNPITGEPVPRTADTLIGGFMKLIGQEEIWENIKKGNAIARAWAWFQGALAGLMGFVRSIPGKVVAAIRSLTFQDVITVAGAFGKIVGAFVNIAGEFIDWGLKQVISLLEILFSVVAPGVMPYIKKAQAAFVTILKNPIGFVGNLVRAGKQGFEMFAANILEHLKAALIKWIVGPLADAGVYIPKTFGLMEIVKLVLSVLGLTWQSIRAKLVKIIPDPILVGLEKTAEILVILVKDGPAAAWEQIKAELSELKDQLIAQVTQMVSTEVVKAAITKLVTMLNPAGAVIQAIIAIYNTITFFIQKIQQIAAVVASFIDSISAIAAGQVASAAKKVEQTMANTLTVVIAFLAKFTGLGNIPDKIVGIVKKIRQPIDKGLDKIVAWLGNMFKKAGQALFSWAFAKTNFVEAGGKSHSIYVEGDKTPRLMIASEPKDAEDFLKWYLDEKEPEFKKKKADVIGRIRAHIKAAKAIATQIAGLKEQGDAWKTRQQDLLKKNVELSGELSKLVGEDGSIGEAIQKYKLEGLTGTYGSIPKPPYDDLTADHQPQAAVLVAAAEFDFFDKDGKLHKRAEGRAHQGYAINLHKARHMAGATYGSKGKATKQSFIAAVNLIKDKPVLEQRKAVVALLKADLSRDVAEVKSKVEANYDAPLWKDVMDKAGSNVKGGKKLVGEIRARIVTGENQIENQDLDSLAN